MRQEVGMGQVLENIKTLQAENSRLQKKLLRLDKQRGDPELQDKYDVLLQETAKLQNKVRKLELGGSDKALLAEVQAENESLMDDNEQLVTFCETMEKQKKALEEQLLAGKQAHAKQNSQISNQIKLIEQLRTDNAALLDKMEKLKDWLKEAKLMSMNGSFMVPVPGEVATGEEQDTELWMTIEELRRQNRDLIEEIQQLKSR